MPDAIVMVELDRADEPSREPTSSIAVRSADRGGTVRSSLPEGRFAGRAVSHHLKGLLIVHAAAAATSGATALLWAWLVDGSPTLPTDPAEFVLAVILSLVGFVVAAAVIAAPAVFVGYPIAVAVARRCEKEIGVLVRGAIAGTAAGSPVTVVIGHLLFGTGPNSWQEQLLFLTPPAVTAGAAMGWVVARREGAERQRKQLAPSSSA
jgi:hypothetical protein